MPAERTEPPLSQQDRLLGAERAENFPVAMRVLPARVRERLHAVYAVLRVIDDLADEPVPVGGSGTEPCPGTTPAQRLRRLEAFRTDLDGVWSGAPVRAPVLAALAPVARDTGLTREPFDRLLDAGVADQRITRYRTWDELLGYCALSAEPVGRIVLTLFGVSAGPELLRDCDAVCTALQLLEHCADVGEDHRRGRTYLPAEDLRAFGVAEADLDADRAGPALRGLLRYETARARALLDGGAVAVAGLRGWARVAVAGYVAGGRAAADALVRADGDVLSGDGRAVRRRADVVRHLPGALLAGGSR
ncbi:squalene synthase HpnC [Pseudonocardia endophytica]|uniref:Squalene synthase HpnC n=1 Tax=Pseudonocardia endophytica TaxID=401976 RepID=A0A4R1HSY7_PSEEN|nr:squalene synthase HpnC [Pseudonocardia endophytica]TCK20512.1 squalene synthase HpnC [Pseudonocardia endophytica]